MFEDNFENRFRSNHHTSQDRFSDMEQWKWASHYGILLRNTESSEELERKLQKKKGERKCVDWSETVSIFQYRERQISPVDFFLSRIIPVSNAYSLSSYRFDATSCFVHSVDPIVSDRIIKKKKKKKKDGRKSREKEKK